MKHIFGMAKSSLDLKPAKSRNLELDFIRLVYAVQHYQRNGCKAHGYLVVLSNAIAHRVAVWAKKYDAQSLVTCLPYPILPEEREVLDREKAANVEGMIAGTQRETVGRRSDAVAGRKIGEHALRDAILQAEPLVQDLTDSKQMPFRIRWDFYGTVG